MQSKVIIDFYRILLYFETKEDVSYRVYLQRLFFIE